MIVVATHNGKDSLNRLLNSMAVFGTDDALVLVVASGETEHVDQMVKAFKPAIPSLRWVPEPRNAFETGAWIEAYRSCVSSRYLFIQDSMEVTAPGWYKQFDDIAETRTYKGSYEFCVPWVTFTPYLLGVTPEVRNRIIEVYGVYAEPGFGIFGSMFYTSRDSLRRIEKSGYLNYVPKDKTDSEAYERWWALIFHRLGIPIMPIHADGFPEIHAGRQFPKLTKHFHHSAGAARGEQNG